MNHNILKTSGAVSFSIFLTLCALGNLSLEGKLSIKPVPQGNLTTAHSPFYPLSQKSIIESGTPAQPTDLNLQFSGNALMGMFNATIPSTTCAGDELTGDLTCTVLLDGVETRTFTTYPGERLYEFMEVSVPGMHTFGVTVTNSVGTSPLAEINQWIGDDELTPVANVKLTLEGDMASLSWDAPVPVHGGYYDPDLLSYNITRLPDNVKVAEGALFNFYMGVLPTKDDMTMWKFRVDLSITDKLYPRLNQILRT